MDNNIEMSQPRSEQSQNWLESDDGIPVPEFAGDKDMPEEQSEQDTPDMHNSEITADDTERESTPENLNANNNIYREIAKNALMNWNGLSEEEANAEVDGATVEALEKQIYGGDSIKAAIFGINNALERRHLEPEDGDKLLDDVFNSEKTADSLRSLGEKLEQVEDKEYFTLDVLSDIHEDWIKHNLDKINNPDRVKKRYQFMPIELIGIKEAKADLLFVNPIFEAVGMEIDEAELGYEYQRYSSENIPSSIKRDILDNYYNGYGKYATGIFFGDMLKEASNVRAFNRILTILEGHASSSDSDFEIDYSNTENTDAFDIREERKRRIDNPAWWGARDQYASEWENEMRRREAEQGWTTVTDYRKPTKEEYEMRYAAEIANQIYDQLSY